MTEQISRLSLWRKGRGIRPSDLVKNAVSLIISSAGTAVLGIIFWGVATRLEAPHFVGEASAEIAAMMVISSLAQLGFGSTFERFLPIAGEKSKGLVLRGYALCTTMAIVLSMSYLLLGLGHRFIIPTFEGRLVFVLSATAWTIFSLQDAVLIALRSSRYVPIENILYSLAKLICLPIFVGVSIHQGIFLSWILPVLFALIGVSWYLFHNRIPEHAINSNSISQLPSLKTIASLAIAGYVTSILSIFLTSVVALVIVTRLGPTQSAYFYLPAMIATALSQFLWNINISFLVEASTTPEEISRHIKSTVRMTAFIFIPSLIIGVIFAPFLLDLFGSAYSHHGTALLRFLLISVLGTVITEFYSSLVWLDQRVWWLAAREFASLVIYMAVLLSLIGHLGINAAGVAALISSSLQAVLFLPSCVQRYRSATRIVRNPITQSGD
jgi:O-antigen/teichoic acid export membrane protein